MCAPERVGVCVSSLAYPACNARVPQWISLVASLAPPHFSTLSHKRHDFRKTFVEYKMCFDFLRIFFWTISYSKKNSARYCHKCENARYSCHIYWNFNFLDRFSKNLNIKFHQNPSSGSRVVRFRWMDGHDEFFPHISIWVLGIKFHTNPRKAHTDTECSISLLKQQRRRYQIVFEDYSY